MRRRAPATFLPPHIAAFLPPHQPDPHEEGRSRGKGSPFLQSSRLAGGGGAFPPPPQPQYRMEVERAPAAAAPKESSSGAMAVDVPGDVAKPLFDALMSSELGGGRPQYRKVQVPPHRFAPLKKSWLEIYTPVYEHMKVDIRMMNLKARRTQQNHEGKLHKYLHERMPMDHGSNDIYVCKDPKNYEKRNNKRFI